MFKFGSKFSNYKVMIKSLKRGESQDSLQNDRIKESNQAKIETILDPDEVDEKIREEIRFVHEPLAVAIETKVNDPDFEEASVTRIKARRLKISKAIINFLKFLTICNYKIEDVNKEFNSDCWKKTKTQATFRRTTFSRLH